MSSENKFAEDITDGAGRGGGEDVGNRNTIASKNSLHKELHDEEQWHMRENDESDPISFGVFENCSNRLFASDSD